MKQICRLFVLTLGLSSVYGLAIAAEGEPLPWANFAWRVLNLIIFLGIIYYFAGAKIKDFFGGRKERIVSELADLDSRKKQALQHLSEVQVRIKNIESERQAIIDESRKNAEEVAMQIIAEAERMALQINNQAVKNMESAAKIMEKEIRAKLADEIVTKLEENMLKKLDIDEHKKLINNSLAKVVF